jgi:hypothetical protein
MQVKHGRTIASVYRRKHACEVCGQIVRRLVELKNTSGDAARLLACRHSVPLSVRTCTLAHRRRNADFRGVISTFLW